MTTDDILDELTKAFSQIAKHQCSISKEKARIKSLKLRLQHSPQPSGETSEPKPIAIKTVEELWIEENQPEPDHADFYREHGEEVGPADAARFTSFTKRQLGKLLAEGIIHPGPSDGGTKHFYDTQSLIELVTLGEDELRERLSKQRDAKTNKVKNG